MNEEGSQRILKFARYVINYANPPHMTNAATEWYNHDCPLGLEVIKPPLNHHKELKVRQHEKQNLQTSDHTIDILTQRKSLKLYPSFAAGLHTTDKPLKCHIMSHNSWLQYCSASHY